MLIAPLTRADAFDGNSARALCGRIEGGLAGIECGLKERIDEGGLAEAGLACGDPGLGSELQWRRGDA
jgi:hypothetical protein